MRGRGWGELVRPGTRAGAWAEQVAVPAAQHSVAPGAAVNGKAGQHIRKVMLAARWMWAGCAPGFKITGTGFSRAAESEVWSSEILHYMQLQDSDAQLKTKRFEDLGGGGE